MKQILLITIFNLTPFLAFNQSEVWVLDSFYGYEGINNHQSYWYLSSKNYYEYDENGNVVVDTKWYQNTGDKWFVERKALHYNKKNLVDTITISGWNEIQNVWKNQSRIIYTFNSNDLIIQEVQQRWNPGFEIWKDKKIIQTTYDENGNWTALVTDDTYRNIRVFDNDLLIESTFEKKENEEWFTESTINYFYDNAFNLIRQRNTGVSPFIFKNEIHYDYDTQNNRVSSVYYEETSMGNLELIGKDSFVYNIDNQLIEDYHGTWQNSQWNWGKWRHLYHYDANENLENYVIQKRNSENHPWRNHSDRLTIYNQNNQISEDYNYRNWDTINTIWHGGRWTNYDYNQNDLETERITMSWNNHSNDFTDKYEKYIRFYSEKEIGQIQSVEEGCPFMNPYLPFTTIHCNNWELEKEYQLQVFSIDGRFVYNLQFIGCEGFRVDKFLARGWYVFVILEDGKILQKQKIWIY